MTALARSQESGVDIELETALSHGLAAARDHSGSTFIALPVRRVSLPTIVLHADPREALIAWASPTLTIVGVGAAVELRARGRSRCAQIIAGAHAFATDMPDAGDDPRDTMPTLVGGPAHRAVISGTATDLEALGVARPRLLGGLAFVPGGADAAPWTGFGDAWFVLPRWTFVDDGSSAWLVLAVDRLAAVDAARWHRDLARWLDVLALGPLAARARQPRPIGVARPSAREWRARIEAILGAIDAGRLAKCVAARMLALTLAGPVDVPALLSTLAARHAECTRVLIRPPGSATLVTATPELLVRCTGDVVECDAIAGSRRRSGDGRRDVEELLASAKDRREHRLVVEAIRAALTSAGGPPSGPAEPGVRSLAHVHHLHTPLRAVLPRAKHVLELASRLHPTPAVGGTPTVIATDWISRHEAPRGWYAAPVGWFDLEGNGELVVALRAGVIEGATAHLWAGAGIVDGSDPERELEETDVKLRAMLDALDADGWGGAT